MAFCGISALGMPIAGLLGLGLPNDLYSDKIILWKFELYWITIRVTSKLARNYWIALWVI